MKSETKFPIVPEYEKQTINLVRCLWISLVVFIHAGSVTKYNGIFICGNMAFANVAVPGFFFLSGYLLFRNSDFVDIAVYCGKLKDRFFSLVIPYFIWNALFLCWNFFAEYVSWIPWKASEVHYLTSCSILSYSAKQFFLAFWAPIDYPLWYVRALSVLVLLSPPLFFFIKKTKYIGIASLRILYLGFRFSRLGAAGGERGSAVLMLQEAVLIPSLFPA